MFLRNRRAHSRKILNADGWISNATGNAWLPIKVLDISKGGFGFVSTDKLDMQATYQFRIQLPGGSRLMNVEGRATHCIEHHDPISYRVGIEFNKIDVADLAAIEWLVDNKDSVQT